jgi:hypothetical protein
MCNKSMNMDKKGYAFFISYLRRYAAGITISFFSV